MMATTILTLALDAENQQRFNALRKQHYPSHLNKIGAHLTLFHSLPDTTEVRETLIGAAMSQPSFEMRVSGVMSLGRGTAYRVENDDLLRLHASLSIAFEPHLIPQDRQRFRPHIVVQNKVSGEEARALQANLMNASMPWHMHAEGLQWWDYLGGPWRLREMFDFTATAPE